MDGEELGGTNVTMGLAEGGVGIAPSSDKHLSAELLAQVDELRRRSSTARSLSPTPRRTSTPSWPTCKIRL